MPRRQADTSLQRTCAIWVGGTLVYSLEEVVRIAIYAKVNTRPSNSVCRCGAAKNPNPPASLCLGRYVIVLWAIFRINRPFGGAYLSAQKGRPKPPASELQPRRKGKAPPRRTERKWRLQGADGRSVGRFYGFAKNTDRLGAPNIGPSPEAVTASRCDVLVEITRNLLPLPHAPSEERECPCASQVPIVAHGSQIRNNGGGMLLAHSNR